MQALPAVGVLHETVLQKASLQEKGRLAVCIQDVQ